MTQENRFERIKREQAEQKAALRKAVLRRKIKDNALKAGAILVGAVIAIVLATAFFQLVIWNLGVVGLAAALGASVANIGFWTAFGGVFLVAYLSQALVGNVGKFNRS